MKRYQFDTEHLPAARRRVVKRIILVGITAIPLGFAVAYFLNDGLPLASTVVLAPILVGVMGVSARKILANLAQTYETFRLELRPGELTARRSDGPGLTILEEDVQSIEQLRDGSLAVRGRTPQECVCVSVDLLGFEELRAELEQWRDIEPFRQRWTPQTVAPLLLVAVLALPFIIAALGPEFLPDAVLHGGFVSYLGGISAFAVWQVRRSEKRWKKVVFGAVAVVFMVALVGVLTNMMLVG